MKIWKILASGILSCSLLTGTGSAILTVNGTELPVQTILINDQTYVPLRAMVQAFEPSAVIDWLDNTAYITSDQLQLTATVNQRWISSNGHYFHVADGVKLIDHSLMVPVRALAAAMGGSVEWDAQTGAISVHRSTDIPESVAYSEDDLYWLSRIISAEAQGEPLEGKLAVGTVVLNRVASDEFPNSIYEVIFDTQWGVQFTPISNGTIYQEPTAESIMAAQMCLEGITAAEGSLYFLDPEKSTNLWTMENRTYVTTIGCHWFYE